MKRKVFFFILFNIIPLALVLVVLYFAGKKWNGVVAAALGIVLVFSMLAYRGVKRKQTVEAAAQHVTAAKEIFPQLQPDLQALAEQTLLYPHVDAFVLHQNREDFTAQQQQALERIFAKQGTPFVYIGYGEFYNGRSSVEKVSGVRLFAGSRYAVGIYRMESDFAAEDTKDFPFKVVEAERLEEDYWVFVFQLERPRNS